MKNVLNKEGAVWLALVVLTVGSVYNSGSHITAAHIVLAIAAAKFLLIFLYFMEMKSAHRAWQASMTAVVLVICGAIALNL